MCGCLLHSPNWGPGPNPGMCPDWESNRRPFASQAGTQSTEPHQPMAFMLFLEATNPGNCRAPGFGEHSTLDYHITLSAEGQTLGSLMGLFQEHFRRTAPYLLLQQP